MGNFLASIKKELLVIFFSMVPVFELRGAIPLGISLGLSPLHSWVLSVISNILMAGFLLKLLNPIMNYFEKTRLFKSTIGWVKTRSMKKAATIKKYSLIGLFFFVAIPIPTTGVWTASVIASILNLDIKKSLISMGLGVVAAASIVLGLYYGIFI
ncbi:MAG TPA: small multi-drug export protein [Tissierellaceae bacterium]|nr:small multi-drug export protein [Tissierellaceae bacterium]